MGTHIEVFLAPAITVHGGAQEAAVPLLRCQHHCSAAVPNKMQVAARRCPVSPALLAAHAGPRAQQRGS